MASMRQTLNEAITGQIRLLLLTGEAGSGKTRVCAQLGTYADLRGVRVLTGQCYEGQGAPAFWPWLQIVRDYCKDLSAQELLQLLGSLGGRSRSGGSGGALEASGDSSAAGSGARQGPLPIFR